MPAATAAAAPPEEPPAECARFHGLRQGPNRRGSVLGLILAALENRYHALVYIGAGLPAAYRGISATANPINFASYIRAPKLILQGRYDEDTPLRTATEPFFKLLSEPKLLTLYDGGHVPSLEVLMSTTMPWLEEQLGRVGR